MAQTNTNISTTIKTNALVRTASPVAPDPLREVRIMIAAREKQIDQYNSQIKAIQEKQSANAKRQNLLTQANGGMASAAGESLQRESQSMQQQQNLLHQKIGKLKLELFDIRQRYKIAEPQPQGKKR